MSNQAAERWDDWRSPLTADLIATEVRELTDLATDGDAVFWSERRPKEGGRWTILRWAAGGSSDARTS